MPSSQETGVINPREISAIIGGPGRIVSIKGWADDVFIAFRQLGQSINDKQGASGEAGIVITHDTRFEVDINLLQTSRDNFLLRLLLQATLRGGFTYPFLFDDASGTTVAAGGTAVFRKWPDVSYNKNDVLTNTWTLLVLHLEFLLGGNI